MPIFLLTLQNTTDVTLDALDGLIYRMHRFRTCASPIKSLADDILVRYIRFLLASLSRSSHVSQELMITDATYAHQQISVTKLAYGREPVYGWHPSNSEDDQGGICIEMHRRERNNFSVS